LKVSIITVSYNAEKTLARTLESVANQNYSNVEHILIDGGSNDTSMAIAAKSGAHLAMSLSEPDKGIYDAMNKGLALATGDVVAFLNADDFYASDDVLTQVAQVMASNQLDILTGNVAFFRSASVNKIERIYNSGRFDIKKLAIGLMPAHPALFVRQDILVKAGGFKADYKIF
jgi:glycosyltransferase involved in cell wall biosynthesis